MAHFESDILYLYFPVDLIAIISRCHANRPTLLVLVMKYSYLKMWANGRKMQCVITKMTLVINDGYYSKLHLYNE